MPTGADDRAYFRRREDEERRAAQRAATPASDVHRQLADRYAILAVESQPEPQGREAERPPQNQTG